MSEPVMLAVISLLNGAVWLAALLVLARNWHRAHILTMTTIEAQQRWMREQLAVVEIEVEAPAARPVVH